MPQDDSVDLTSLFRLDGAVVILTGASSGLGERFAEVLHSAGAHVVLVARRRVRLDALAARLERVDVLPFDLSEPSSVHEVVDSVVEQHGRLDILINNAGITNIATALKEHHDDVSRVIAMNLIVPYMLAQSAAKVMREHGGNIINIASVTGMKCIASIPEAAYSASKGAIISLTRDLAVQWSRYGVRVNAIAPGMFRTEMTTGLTEVPDALEAFEETVPMGRIGETRELDAAILFLACRANTYMTGQTIVVDGGYTCV